MKKLEISKIYKLIPIIALIIIAICFVFRYSYIDIFSLNRPLQLAVYISTTLGIIGSTLSMIDGVDKNFRGNILIFMLINITLIFTYPILISLETLSRPPANPYADLTPLTDYSTRNRDDAAFILEGELYERPLKAGDFIDRGYEYRKLSDNEINLSKVGKSNEIKPTWFTDGESKKVDAIESYTITLSLSGSGDIYDQNVESIMVKARDNNRDFEIEGINLRESLYKLKEKFKDDLIEDPANKKEPVKIFYLNTKDGYQITFGTFQNRIEYVNIKKEY